MLDTSRSARRTCFWMVLTALALRLVVVSFLYPEHLNPDRDYWRFGGEAARIAASLAEGRGYGNAQFGTTGPTAWLAPVYPLLAAAAFQLFGVHTKASAIALLSLNSLFSAMTCLPVFLLARRAFGDRAGIWAGWTWAFFPYAVFFSADLIWPTTLTTLLLTILLLYVLRLESTQGPWSHFRFGLLSGFAALTDPIVISVLPVLAARMYFRRGRQGLRWKLPATVMALGFLLAVAPWFVRNAVTFHAFVPFRANFGLELHIGNHGDSSHFAPVHDHPSTNEADLKAYTKLGEQAFMAAKQREAVDFIESHPAWFARVTLRRILYMWTSFWSFDPQYQAQEPFDIPNIFLSTVMDLVALAGLYRAFRQGSYLAMPLALVMLLFPMIYYVTHWEDYYRRPIDPVFVVLASYEVWSRVQLRREAVRLLQESPASASD
ncbi:MAG TPA: glycosyltransferase family 39 protein [Patescibacteria group bacterium]|nr:glycosyltransferase family 39 protein [Patescibacteria group bacterium]